jgi:hypothetical protein
MKNKIIFYSLIYKVKSKVDFEKYEEWGNNLIKNIKDHPLIIYTDKYTYNLLKHILNNDNIKIIFLELTEFKYYKYIDFLDKSKKLTEGYNIDPKLLLIWLERIIILDNLKNLISSEFYSFVDFGYFRDEKIYDNFLNNDIILNKEKIYYCLIKNDILYLKNNILLYYIENKEYPTKNDGMIGGGFFIIHSDKINFYINLYESKLLLYINNNRLIKDDQIILIDIIFDKNNIEHFELITDIDSHLNIAYKNKIIQNNNYKDFIQSIYYSKLIFQNNQKSNLYNDYINITEKTYEIKNFDNIINYKNDDNWFCFKKLLSDSNYVNYIINSHKFLFYDYYLGYNVNYDIYYENNIIIVMKNNYNMYISFKNDLNELNYLILYEILYIFINIHILNINNTYNIDYEIIIELSKIFNFKFIYCNSY